MSFTITNPMAFFAGLAVVLTAFVGLIAYMGDGRWRKKTDDHEFRSSVSGKIGALELAQQRHEERLTAGDRTMNRVEGMLQSQSAQLTGIISSVARLEGQRSQIQQEVPR